MRFPEHRNPLAVRGDAVDLQLRGADHEVDVLHTVVALESSLVWAEQALAIHERLDDPLGIASTLHRIAEALRDLGDFVRSALACVAARNVDATTAGRLWTLAEHADAANTDALTAAAETVKG